MDYIFTKEELKWLDDMIPEEHKRETEELENQTSQVQVAQRLLSLAGPGGLVNLPLCDGNLMQFNIENKGWATLLEPTGEETRRRYSIGESLTSKNSSDETHTEAVTNSLIDRELYSRRKSSGYVMKRAAGIAEGESDTATKSVAYSGGARHTLEPTQEEEEDV